MSSLVVGLKVFQNLGGSHFSPWTAVVLRQLIVCVLGSTACVYVVWVPCCALACFPSAVASKGSSAASGEQRLPDCFPGPETASAIITAAKFLMICIWPV